MLKASSFNFNRANPTFTTGRPNNQILIETIRPPASLRYCMENRTHGFAIQEDAQAREPIEREAELEQQKKLTPEEYTPLTGNYQSSTNIPGPWLAWRNDRTRIYQERFHTELSASLGEGRFVPAIQSPSLYPMPIPKGQASNHRHQTPLP